MSTLEKIRALNRFGLGARAGEVNSSALNDPRGWLENQVLHGDVAMDSDILSQGVVYDTVGLGSTLDIHTDYYYWHNNPAGNRNHSRFSLGIYGLETKAIWQQAYITDVPFIERLVHFWTNHFAISTVTGALTICHAGTYSRDAIRPHVLGKFEDMLLASARHPAMLVYLDNYSSRGPNSSYSRTRGGGNNENYARELLELHTMGVDGGYTQDDVEQLSLILTGWTFGGVSGGGTPFLYRGELHEPGSKTLLGRTFEEDGENEGIEAIKMLVQHDSTAEFIATKLVQFFVSYSPSASDIATIAQRFRDTNGDLAQVTLALINLDSAYHIDNQKLRTPQDFLFAASRAFNVSQDNSTAAKNLNQQLWAPTTPQGYVDQLRPWAAPSSLVERIDIGQDFGKKITGISTPPEELIDDILEIREPNHHKLMMEIMEQDTQQLAYGSIISSPNFQWR